MTDNWNMLGHEWAVEMLRQQVGREETRHAYLFCGPPGVGRRTLALRFAQALNCTNQTIPGEACGSCRECKQIVAMQHPDLAVIQAEKEGGILKVDQVRELRRIINLKPYQSKYRVALFLRFQEANDNAANALLKTLEEAPAHAILILTADHPEQLLPTIVSRCEVLQLRPLPLQAIEADLKANGLEPEGCRLLAHLSDGRPGYARRLLGGLKNDGHGEGRNLVADRLERLDELQHLLQATRVEKFRYAENLAKDRDSLRNAIMIWSSYWRDVWLRAIHADVPICNIDRRTEIETLAGRLNLANISRVARTLGSALVKIERNVNARLVAEVLLLDLPK